ncbi:MAG: hypothetical protein FWE42_06755 [Defluviitaleaceae bacterium]|nr:hypothetical protein [Defluviitaleaceae bacterium]
MSIIPLIDQEFKALIPPHTAEERAQLEQNILKKRRCYDAIVLWRDYVLDGHMRYEICIKHGIEFEVIKLPLATREEAKLWILENQLGRRNLCDAARIEISLLKTELLQSMAKKNLKNGGRPSKHAGEKGMAKITQSTDNPILVRKIHASDAGVGERTVGRYAQIKREAHPLLLAKVQSGEVKIGTAHRMLPSEIIKCLDRMDKMYKFVADAIPPEGLKAANPELHAQLCGVLKTLEKLVAALEERRGGSRLE